MKLIRVILSATVIAGTLVHCRAANEVLSVAVFNFEASDDVARDLGPKVAALLTAQLSLEPQLIMVERAELEKALGEQEMGLSGTISPDAAAKVGHLIGAKILVTGRVMKVEKELILVAKVIGTETSRVYGEMAKANSLFPITDLAADLAKKIVATIIQRSGTLVPKVRSREDRVETIKKRLKPGQLAAVEVRIRERHYGGPTIDPAAETEISLILQQCGFTLVDEKSVQKADFEILGEAFSDFAMRKGNLVSCKARVEVKLRSKADGKLLAADRETTVAVNLSEQIAGKAALAEAGAELAERLLPKLAAR